mgnify:CR=1 FL=1
MQCFKLFKVITEEIQLYTSELLKQYDDSKAEKERERLMERISALNRCYGRINKRVRTFIIDNSKTPTSHEQDIPPQMVK